jgi:hypothetical protein
MLRFMHDTVREVYNSNSCGGTWFLEAAATSGEGWRWGDGVLQSANNDGYDYDANGYEKISDEGWIDGRCLRLRSNNKDWAEKSCDGDDYRVACMVSLSPSARLGPLHATTFLSSLLPSSPSSLPSTLPLLPRLTHSNLNLSPSLPFLQ